MNKPDYISESLETIFWVKILEFFDADPGCKKFGSGIRDKHPGSATLLFSHFFEHFLVQSTAIAMSPMFSA
jgi:hypothetical protein